MAESTEDKDVDTLIADVQSALDKLKAAQRKDVSAEDSEETSEPKDLNGAERKAQRLVAARKASEK
jgi:hypothetical protein